jgi:serine/threonine-protein kinase
VKLLDFGIAAAAGSANASGHLLGTPYYMSPEQILGRTMDGRSDLYSLGILAYELATHEVPFDAETIDELLAKHVAEETPDPKWKVPDVPDDLREFILKSTAKRPEDRYATCAEAERFLKLATELPVVHRIELSTLAISYHPSRRAMVEQALAELTAKLGEMPGIALLHALQQSREPGKD